MQHPWNGAGAAVRGAKNAGVVIRASARVAAWGARSGRTGAAAGVAQAGQAEGAFQESDSM
jgi:hypothetical protein